MTRIFWTRRPRDQFIFEQQTSVQVHLPDNLRSALAAATHTELARSPPLAGLSVRRVKQSISRTSAVHPRFSLQASCGASPCSCELRCGCVGSCLGRQHQATSLSFLFPRWWRITVLTAGRLPNAWLRHEGHSQRFMWLQPSFPLNTVQ